MQHCEGIPKGAGKVQAMTSSILVPLDGSPRSESVLPWLRLLCSKDTTAKVALIRCFQPISSVYFLPDLDISPAGYLSIEKLEQMMLEYLNQKAAQLDGLQVSVSAVVNDAANGILDKARDFDLTLMAAQGGGGPSRWLLGSVASKVSHGTTRPIMVLTAKTVECPTKIGTIMVAVDGSEAAERAVAKAAELSLQQGSRLFLYRAVGQTEVLHSSIAESNRQHLEAAEAYLKKLAATIEGVEVETEARGVRDQTEIVKAAEEKRADLLIMGSRGRGGLERWLLGSQTEKALREANCPVLIVP